MSTISDNQLNLFQSLFKAREDVYAMRWEKDGKSGYMPAYEINWDEFNRHKAQGGTFKTFKNKKYLPLTKEKLAEHLSGKHTIGVYPLLSDNTSFFIAADFDEQEWLKDSLKLIKTFQEFEIPACLERSRSGKGGHVWIFFESNYPAWKSRKIFFELLRRADILSTFDSEASFDRLFPNQDYHSGLGLGNLIALPLNKRSMELGNSCFIDPRTLLPYPDQWKFLSDISKVRLSKLNELYDSFCDNDSNTAIPEIPGNFLKFQIALGNHIILNKNSIPPRISIFLKDNLNFLNREFFLKKKLGRNTFNTEINFKLIKEQSDEIILPRGFIRKLISFCKEEKIEYHFEDQRIKHTEVNFSSCITLREYQSKAFEVLYKKDFGVIVAPAGSGKTIIGLELIARKKQPALIVVHRKQLFDQWLERIQSFLSIPKNEIGQVIGGKQRIGKQITVAMIQSLDSIVDDLNVGTVIIDECHHIPAKTFRESIEKIQTFYLYGLTATPKRKNNDESLIYSFIGDILTEIRPNPDTKENKSKSVKINIRETDFQFPFDQKTDNQEMLFQALTNDTSRNQFIINDVIMEAEKGRNILILTERKAHIKMLFQYLHNKFEVITISGEDPEKERIYKLKQIKEGHFPIVISTGQFLGEGTDIDNLNCLFLVFPFSFEGKLIQYIGRIQRGSYASVVYDYRDSNLAYLENLFKKRNRYYKRIFEIRLPEKHEELILRFDKEKVYVNNEDNVLSIQDLGLPDWIKEFKEEVCWKVRVIKYIESERRVFCEIINYNLNEEKIQLNNQSCLYEIEKITFRSVDTTGLMQSSVRKRDHITFNTDSPHSTRSSKTHIKNDVSFDEIDFNYGYISFRQHVLQIGKTVTFRIDNVEIRPEFDSIRNYFKKTLRVKMISYEAEVDRNISSTIPVKASSKEIDRISSDLIENVKFTFVKSRVSKYKTEDGNYMYTDDELLKASGNDSRVSSLYRSDTELFDAILKTKKSKHYYHLKYLAGKHKSTIVKLRFIINPFSFIFLLEGKTNYHIVWETLDTKEATYLWHVEKSIQALELKFERIQEVINQSKIDGKINYLSSKPEEFTRIYHDYSDPDKGFILWKGMLDEKIC